MSERPTRNRKSRHLRPMSDAIPAAAAFASALAGYQRPELAEAYGVIARGREDCANFLSEHGFADDYISDICGEAVEVATKSIEMDCESPIEAMTLASLVFADWSPFMTIPAQICRPRRPVPKGDVVICPQFNFGHYRLDFLVMGRVSGRHPALLNVECDGDEFHNANMEQWNRDAARDQYVMACGVSVIRLSGKRIFHDPYGCAKDVVENLRELVR